MPLCNSKTIDGACRTTSQLCAADPAFSIDFANAIRVPLNTQLLGLEDQARALRIVDAETGARTPVQIGDINLDGYSDVMMVVQPPTGSSSAVLMENIPCTEELCGEAATREERRTLAPLTKGVDALFQVANVKRATFVDLGEKGSLDIVLMTQSPVTQQRSLEFLFNNFMSDAFFLKTLGMSVASVQTLLAESDYE